MIVVPRQHVRLIRPGAAGADTGAGGGAPGEGPAGRGNRKVIIYDRRSLGQSAGLKTLRY